MKQVCLAAALALNVARADRLSANPIRKVVTMLQMMEQRVREEGEEEEKAFDKYMCWCKTGGGDLEKSITDGTTKVGELGSSIKAGDGELAQLSEDLASHKA